MSGVVSRVCGMLLNVHKCCSTIGCVWMGLGGLWCAGLVRVSGIP